MSKKAITALALAAVAAVALVLIFMRRQQAAPLTSSAPAPQPLTPAAAAAVAFRDFVGSISGWAAQYTVDKITGGGSSSGVSTFPEQVDSKPPSLTNNLPKPNLVTSPMYFA